MVPDTIALAGTAAFQHGESPGNEQTVPSAYSAAESCDWAKGYVRCLGVRLDGHAIEEKDSKGKPLLDETFLMLLNAHHEPRPFTLPAHKRGVRWQPVLETAISHVNQKQVTLLKGGFQYDLEARSLAVLRLRPKS